MWEVFEIIFWVIGKVLGFWMNMNINGFHPFWYLVSLSLLGLLGSVFSGSSSGVGSIFGGWASGGNKTIKNKIIIKNK
jgi:hypothetical protein